MGEAITLWTVLIGGVMVYKCLLDQYRRKGGCCKSCCGGGGGKRSVGGHNPEKGTSPYLASGESVTVSHKPAVPADNNGF